jgi:hypothetical protein
MIRNSCEIVAFVVYRGRGRSWRRSRFFFMVGDRTCVKPHPERHVCQRIQWLPQLYGILFFPRIIFPYCNELREEV